MADEAGFVINGKPYEIPSLDTFDMDEAMVLYELSGLTLEDFALADDEDEEASAALAAKLKNPGFLRALMQIAYTRGNPGMTAAKAKAAIGKSNLLQALQDFAGDDASPPDERPKSELETSSSSESSDSSPSSSGADSRNGSDAPDESLERTGTTESDTSSLPSVPIRSVA